MSEPHLQPAEAELYVLGALEPQAAAALEAHTLTCPPCAQLLQREALLEEQLREVAQAAELEARVIRPARWRRVPLAAAAAALLAAAAVALFLLRTEAAAPSPAESAFTMTQPEVMGQPEAMAQSEALPERQVACPDLSTQEACIAEALAHGLLVQYPQGVGEVPRYARSSEIPPAALQANGPYPL